MTTNWIRPDAAPAWEALGRALAGLDRPPPCHDRGDQWFADEDWRRRDAIEACWVCPAVAACRAFAEANGEVHGVWGGVDMEAPVDERRTA